jgi:hypothetical protein
MFLLYKRTLKNPVKIIIHISQPHCKKNQALPPCLIYLIKNPLQAARLQGITDYRVSNQIVKSNYASVVSTGACSDVQ